jgi:serine/threonine protein phosphatase PrpC
MNAATATCPACASTVTATDRYCERCGHELWAGGELVDSGGLEISWRSSTPGRSPCAGCGATDPGIEGYCANCGRPFVIGRDRVELDLTGVAGVTDKGLSRRRNEDALAIGRIAAAGTPGAVTVAVVSDGVSSAPRGDAAANAAVDAGITALLDALAAGAAPVPATELAAHAANAAVAALAPSGSTWDPPSCTYVSAVVTDRDVTVGWLGDSRAYWLAADPAGARMLTVDDSPAARRAAAGAAAAGAAAAGAAADPRDLALLRWLGVDVADPTPQVVTFAPDGPGRLLLCSDGLSRYFTTPDRLAANAPVDGSVAVAARVLTQAALDAGGRDNIAIALLPFPPPDRPEVS